MDDDDHNASNIMHPRVVLPQLSTKKRSLNYDNDKTLSPPKRPRFEESQRFTTQTTFECYNTTRPFTVTTDIKMIDHSYDEQQSTINSTKTESTSSIEQTLPLATSTHRFISKKIFKPETCFVVSKMTNIFFKHFF
jgi:hypothetical protein